MSRKAAGTNEWPVLLLEDQSAWENWLENNHDVSSGVRLQIAKKNSGVDSVSYAEALESALCYGWIDSQKEAWDDKLWIQRFSPRGPRSVWSQVNKDKVELLISSGRMKPSGLKAVELAKQNGRWDTAYASQSKSKIPDDLAFALQNNPKAKAFFDTLDNQNRYAILYRVQNVKKAETRARKIEQFISMLENGEKIYP